MAKLTFTPSKFVVDTNVTHKCPQCDSDVTHFILEMGSHSFHGGSKPGHDDEDDPGGIVIKAYCPVCRTLFAKEAEAKGLSDTGSQPAFYCMIRRQSYACPVHPYVTSNVQGTCPLCGASMQAITA